MLQAGPKCSLCRRAETSIPMLMGPSQKHCLKCVLINASCNYQVISFLMEPIVKMGGKQKKIICYDGRFVLSSSSSSGIGLCIVNKNFKENYQFWPIESLNIEINGETLWSSMSRNYYVSEDVQASEKQRFIDLRIRMEQHPNVEYILAVFEIKPLLIDQLIQKDLDKIINKSRHFVESFYKKIENENKLLEFSLRCPFSWNIIKIPIRFMECEHYQPIDYLSLVTLLNYENKTLRCPYCSKQTSLSRLIIDEYQYNTVMIEIDNLEKLPQQERKQYMYVQNFRRPNNYLIGKIKQVDINSTD